MASSHGCGVRGATDVTSNRCSAFSESQPMAWFGASVRNELVDISLVPGLRSIGVDGSSGDNVK